MELQKKLDEFRANFEMDIGRKTILDNEALRVKSAGVEARALKAASVLLTSNSLIWQGTKLHSHNYAPRDPLP